MAWGDGGRHGEKTAGKAGRSRHVEIEGDMGGGGISKKVFFYIPMQFILADIYIYIQYCTYM